ncbi:MAG: hypothetical protein QNJ46_19030 [Leptolyngbyaceae cyanobacterium MO_188.B28]|nr:hypothetical protein [Leptolyngbyaceae cyanobacterium MO_188.B28]
MSQTFRVFHLRLKREIAIFESVRRYLHQLYSHMYNPIHAEARVYTCHELKNTTIDKIVPYELHWNDDDLLGEQFLGDFGSWFVNNEIVDRIEAEFSKGEAVRLFIFDSDSDLRREEILIPINED